MLKNIQKNDKKASRIILIFSAIIFLAIVLLGRFKLNVQLGFDAHLFAKANAIINTTVAILLVLALYFVKNKKYELHKKTMLIAMWLSVLFLVFYVCHHFLAAETKFGGTGAIRYFYFFILSTHILLAAIIMPFILFTAYRALIGELDKHKKLAKITWPIWFYVAVTGPIIYLLIAPYY